MNKVINKFLLLIPQPVALLKVFILLILTSSVFASENLISVVISRNGDVSYVTISPLYFDAQRKGQDPVRTKPGASIAQQMELTIYSTCNRTEPQVFDVSLLLRPHLNDPEPAYYLSGTGIGRMLKQFALRGGEPFFNEKGTLTLLGVQNAVWPVTIARADFTATGAKGSYSIGFDNPENQRKFIQTFEPIGRYSAGKNPPQAILVLQSPSIQVRATYALIHPSTENYKKFKSVNISNWWSKQLAWCPS